MSPHQNTDALDCVVAEMHNQDFEHGANRNLPHLEWNAILVEEVGEVSKAIQEREGLREELVQVAAVALQWIEMIDRGEMK
jgi:hypothetical protein